MRYVRRASPLHAARAVAGALWCAAVATAALAAPHPLVLGALTVGVLAAAAFAGVLREVGRLALWMLPWALVIALINTLVVRDGLTVLARLGELPPFGQMDLTLEALVYGVLFGLRLLTVSLAFALFSAAVDPDDLLRVLRRLSLRSALAATLATRLVPVLAADARRIEEARRCRPDGGGHGAAARVALLRAVAGNALDRALDVAATLEVRGYGGPRRAPRSRGRLRGSGAPWSRHDLAFTGSALALLAVTIVARVRDLASFGTYPQLHGAAAGDAAALAALLLVVMLAPFAARRGIEP